MNDLGLVSLIASAGWLVLAFSAYRSHRVGAKRSIAYGLTWAALFGAVFLVFMWIGG